jgi:hypothetical protein
MPFVSSDRKNGMKLYATKGGDFQRATVASALVQLRNPQHKLACNYKFPVSEVP